MKCNELRYHYNRIIKNTLKIIRINTDLFILMDIFGYGYGYPSYHWFSQGLVTDVGACANDTEL